MAERFRPAHPGGGGRPPPSRTANPPPTTNHAAPPSAAAPTNSSTTVRRNLFQSQLTRRPTGPAATIVPAIDSDSDSPSSPSATSAAETLRLDDPRAAHALLFPTGSGNDYGMRSPTDARSGGGGGGGGLGFPDEDIVIRDKNGEVELSGDPASPDVGGGGGGGNNGVGEEDDDEEAAAAAEAAAAVEAEKERQRLAEAVRQHQVDQNSVPVQPEELLEAVRASLKAKVAALADDNWMYEREDLPRNR
ncbi:hypothetical protein B0T18DRAFT_426537 [Schizothecium vesticola]|uniref:Uncharacterized protein n=1 Tax=Schizothecium vesticola TaxID=314040 RepID=A0AA40KAW9_9PEZI|nr:hypothetical protein B0T18DRAFT_426537 [Schizothecium vesticola]